MRQTTLAEGSFARYKKVTRKEKFLGQMDEIIPRKELCQAIEPHCPNPGGSGRRPVGIERMLRTHFMQHWFNLSDPGIEEALYDTPAMREFAGMDIGNEAAADATTICKFHHLLEKKDPGGRLFDLVNEYLQENGLFVSRGTIVDATIMDAPTSTKNKDKQRDPKMHQTRKGNQWYFGMKAHVGVDSQSRLIHSVAVTPANTHDSRLPEDLLHGEETVVWGDSAYSGQESVLKRCAPGARDMTHKKGAHKIAS